MSLEMPLQTNMRRQGDRSSSTATDQARSHPPTGMGTPTRSPGREGLHGWHNAKLPSAPGLSAPFGRCAVPQSRRQDPTDVDPGPADVHTCLGATTVAGSGLFYHNLGEQIKKQEY